MAIFMGVFLLFSVSAKQQIRSVKQITAQLTLTTTPTKQNKKNAV